MVIRLLQKTIETKLFKGKAILISGPCQSGTFTITEAPLRNKDYLYMNG
ncbi:MAG: hypothetical protein PW786_05045 [Arachidicoccus sp.]|nr:hypothetical protein [Arachidicoccus sp.]